jgi:hypothetical protein
MGVVINSFYNLLDDETVFQVMLFITFQTPASTSADTGSIPSFMKYLTNS